jgi:hypothetical protein
MLQEVFHLRNIKKSAHPRTFNEMFNEGGDRLAESGTFDSIYGKLQEEETAEDKRQRRLMKAKSKGPAAEAKERKYQQTDAWKKKAKNQSDKYDKAKKKRNERILGTRSKTYDL